MECDTCTRWYHGSCVGTSQEELDALGDAQWECPECQISRCVNPAHADAPSIPSSGAAHQAEDSHLSFLIQEEM